GNEPDPLACRPWYAGRRFSRERRAVDDEIAAVRRLHHLDDMALGRQVEAVVSIRRVAHPVRDRSLARHQDQPAPPRQPAHTPPRLTPRLQRADARIEAILVTAKSGANLTRGPQCRLAELEHATDRVGTIGADRVHKQLIWDKAAALAGPAILEAAVVVVEQ